MISGQKIQVFLFCLLWSLMVLKLDKGITSNIVGNSKKQNSGKSSD